jgi:hypothetical protein
MNRDEYFFLAKAVAELGWAPGSAAFATAYDVDAGFVATLQGWADRASACDTGAGPDWRPHAPDATGVRPIGRGEQFDISAWFRSVPTP